MTLGVSARNERLSCFYDRYPVGEKTELPAARRHYVFRLKWWLIDTAVNKRTSPGQICRGCLSYFRFYGSFFFERVKTFMCLQKKKTTFALSPLQTGRTSSIRITSFVVKCNFKQQPLQRDFIRKRSTLTALVASSSEEYGGFAILCS